MRTCLLEWIEVHMRIFITGAAGQLGNALQERLSGHELALADLPELDVTDKEAIEEAIIATAPDVVIHCAAYTDVDACARDPTLAYRVNSLGAQNVAVACLKASAQMVHISTNEVFPGLRPDGYEEWMPVEPVNPYAVSKVAAESHVRSILAPHYIVRTAWLFAPGGKNFVHAILHAARRHGRLRVVADEFGNPTYVHDLAEAITELIQTGQFGTYHLVNEGACSRLQFAREALRICGLEEVSITPILSSDYKRASSPPLASALQNRAAAALGIRLRPWQEALAAYLETHWDND
jgi:dTDP-4-dehydrorhamnose reductase